MSCANCERAATTAWWPIYTATCHGCAMRELAQSPGFFYSMQAGRFRNDYTHELRAIFGRNKADIERGHRQVKAAWDALHQPRLIA